MLLNLREYQRPAAGSGGAEQREALERALVLLARHETRTVPLAGGDNLVASADRSIEAVVDLQGLGLDSILLEPAGEGYARFTAHVGDWRHGHEDGARDIRRP